jgi:hypothetical protein
MLQQRVSRTEINPSRFDALDGGIFGDFVPSEQDPAEWSQDFALFEQPQHALCVLLLSDTI